MMKLPLLTTGVATAGVVLAGAIGYTQRPGVEPSPCLTQATLQLLAIPAEVELGEASELRWTVDVPDGCEGAEIRLDGHRVQASGRRWSAPVADRVFRLAVSAQRAGVATERTITAAVRVHYPQTVFINRHTPNAAAVLLGALASSNETQVIELCDVDLDLTGLGNIGIGKGRSLIASPSCARGEHHDGPRIFVSDAQVSRPIFVVTADSVVISGFRLHGPTGGTLSADMHRAIMLAASAQPRRSIEISNMEIAPW